MEVEKNDVGMEIPKQKTDSATALSLNIGSVLGRSFGILSKKPGIFFGLMLLAALPSFLLTLAIHSSESQGAVAALPKIVELVLGTAIQGATAYAVFQTLRGDKVSFGESITRGMARLIPLGIAALLVGLGVGLGAALFLIPGLILMCLWYVTIPACVVERLGPIESMSRSRKLTLGYRWPIFGLILLVVIATALLYGVVVGLASMDDTFFFSALMLVAFIVPQTLANIIVAIVYFDLRAIKEGVTIDNLANVFD